ncbi:MAG: DUF2310 family Zn-ribbon-containing protein, partial [Ignavibacteria bacterium]|nr:DUF2310 family Zn-ribbon-containing protein [Ignavibacteria bacterium]
KRCDGLQMGCFTGEKFGTREISKINSSLNYRGVNITEKLTKYLKMPVYYYLYSGYGKSIKNELSRSCPKCGNKKWMLKEPLHDMFDYKCDNCYLLSNISWNLRSRYYYKKGYKN